MEKATWPKTKAGTIDWVVVFENPDTGLIALISQAHSAHALHDIVLAIIKQLYTRKDDSHDIEHFTEELESLIPDDAGDDDLPHLIEGVNAILREIKEECIRKAAEHTHHKVFLKDGEKRDAAKHAQKATKEKKPVSLWLTGGALTIAVLSISLYFAFTEEKAESPIQVLIHQMTAAVAGEAAATHVYQGKIRREQKYGRTVVSAYGLPFDACSSAAWYFVNRGTIIINGQMPMQVSPNILKKFCSQNPAGATLTWVPK